MGDMYAGDEEEMWTKRGKTRWTRSTSNRKHKVELKVTKSRIPGAGKGLFVACDVSEGTVLGRLFGRVRFVSDSKRDAEAWGLGRGESRLVLLSVGKRRESGWAVVDVRGSVFEWMNSSESEETESVHVSQRGWVSATRDLGAGAELLWFYGDSFNF